MSTVSQERKSIATKGNSLKQRPRGLEAHGLGVEMGGLNVSTLTVRCWNRQEPD